MEYLPLTALYLAIPLMIVRPFCVLIHEIGHAVPALITTREKVAIYIGSYGNTGTSFRLKLGRLEMWVRYNPLMWGLQGMCEYKGLPSIHSQIIIILFGPLASLFLFILTLVCISQFDPHGSVKLLLVALVFSSFIDALNLLPYGPPMVLENGSILNRDGVSIRMILGIKRDFEDLNRAVDIYNTGDYEKTREIVYKLREKDLKNETLYQLGLYAEASLKNFVKAKPFADDLMGHTQGITQTDFTWAAYVYAKTALFDEAGRCYERCLALFPDDAAALNGKGYILTVLEKYHEAIPPLDLCIQNEPTLAYAYNNRGLAKIKTGDVESGLADIYHSRELDPSNAYVYRNLGIYHLDRGEYREALEFFDQAKSCDNIPHDIDVLTRQANQREIQPPRPI